MARQRGRLLHGGSKAKECGGLALSPHEETDVDTQRYVTTFLKALEQLGWTHGRNLHIDYRWAGADRNLVERYALELVRLEPELIVAHNTPSVAALQRATRTISIIFVNVSDPLGSGFVQSLSRPGTNITGFSNFEPSMGGKWAGLVKDIAPQTTRIALISNPETSPQSKSYIPYIESAALSLGLKPVVTPVHNTSELDRVIGALGRDPGSALILLSDVFTFVNREVVVKLAEQHRVPAVYPFREFAKSGGLISYGVNQAAQWTRAASYVHRILNAEKLSELPVEAPINFELLINVKTAKALGLTIPDKLLALADEVIE